MKLANGPTAQWPLLIALVCGIAWCFPAAAAGGSSNANASAPSKKDLASRIHGRIQIVDSFADYRVQVVKSFPDLRVQVVQSFPNSPGKWQMVKSFPDYKIQLVDSFPDFKIQYVDMFPGTP